METFINTYFRLNYCMPIGNFNYLFKDITVFGSSSNLLIYLIHYSEFIYFFVVYDMNNISGVLINQIKFVYLNIHRQWTSHRILGRL
jgi:hypothetical protein